MDVKDVIALVTGGASGLGGATAEALAAAGARVAVLDRNEAAAEAMAARIGGLALACDVADEASAEAAFDKLLATWGAPRILVNCAGIGTPGRVVSKEGPMPLAQFRKVIEVNLIGTFNMIRLMAAAALPLPALADGERGVIVNTASIAAFDGQIGQAAYSASKGGIVGMTLPLAREFARGGIRVVTIAPGIFATPLLMGLAEEVRASLAANVPFPARLGEPPEFAALVMHIIGNVMLNGETIRLDGALRMPPR
jgi:NAD(P)-dependent dehydrogenase (short-subunit alcohol dehydrogenase family)